MAGCSSLASRLRQKINLSRRLSQVLSKCQFYSLYCCVVCSPEILYVASWAWGILCPITWYLFRSLAILTDKSACTKLWVNIKDIFVLCWLSLHSFSYNLIDSLPFAMEGTLLTAISCTLTHFISPLTYFWWSLRSFTGFDSSSNLLAIETSIHNPAHKKRWHNCTCTLVLLP